MGHVQNTFMSLRKLHNAHRPIHKDFLIAILFSGLPPKYEAFITGVIKNLRLNDSSLSTSNDDNNKSLKIF
jgi:hypothetical protein